MKNPSLPMLASAALLVMALADGSPAAEKPFALDESEVRITYGELKRLVAAQEKAAPPHPPPKPPPVPAALIATSCKADLTPGKETLTVGFQYENFTGAWEIVPLARSSAGAAVCEPPEARFVTHEGHICAVTETAGRGNAKLAFPLRIEEPLGLAFLPCAVLSLEVSNAAGRSLLLKREGGETILAREGAVALPSDGGEIRFTLEDGSAPQPQGAETLANTDAAIMSSAEYATIVAPDGALLTEGVIKIHLDQPAALPLVLPDGARLLSCRVGGRPLRPALKDKGLDIPLQAAREGAEAVEVCVAYTEARPALAAAEGELEIALPQSPWFAREVLWSVKFPPGLQLTAIGNVEAVPAPAPGSQDTLHLKKSLCRDDRPAARITYRKRSYPINDKRQAQ